MTDTAPLAQSTQSAPTTQNAAAQWGLASLLLGGFLAVLAILVVQINLQMFITPRSWSPGDVYPIRYVAIAGSFILFGMTCAGIGFGVRGLLLARKHAEPCALGWAGLMISVLALLLWIGTLVDLFSVSAMLLRQSLPFR